MPEPVPLHYSYVCGRTGAFQHRTQVTCVAGQPDYKTKKLWKRCGDEKQITPLEPRRNLPSYKSLSESIDPWKPRKKT